MNDDLLQLDYGATRRKNTLGRFGLIVMFTLVTPAEPGNANHEAGDTTLTAFVCKVMPSWFGGHVRLSVLPVTLEFMLTCATAAKIGRAHV